MTAYRIGALGALIAIVSLVGMTILRDDSNADRSTTTAASTIDAPDDVEVLGQAPTLTKIDGWLNSEATTIEDVLAANEVTVVQFWTFGCRNCKATLPNLQALYADHQADSFEIVGVHSPEFDFEADPDNIAEALVDLGVTWPVALDTSKANFHEWQEGSTAYWPRTYVVDNQGQIRFDHIGEGAYDELNTVVDQLLAAP